MPHALIVRELDVPPDVLRQLAVNRPERYPVLLDSAADGPLSRSSVLVATPTAALWLDARGQLQAEGAIPPCVVLPGEGFLRALERWIAAELTPSDPTDLPFRGGWAVFLGYEVAGEIEPRLALPRPSAPAALLRQTCSAAVTPARPRR